ncbi:hypothetical protein FPRO04_12190 [Fusarium proliferatum]|nr:hypothetical protein FPRO04_12190 [Fusarium proliferatum]
MVSNKLILAAFAALASVANASPCKPSLTKAITTSATETVGSSTYIETSTAITESETVTQSETTTTEALSTEASTTGAESATTTTTVDEPLLTNADFEDGTTAPWQLQTERGDTLTLGSGYQSPASGKVQFGNVQGSQYANLITQKINKKALKAGLYELQGYTRVDSYSQSGDGCSRIIAACLTGSGDNSVIRCVWAGAYLDSVELKPATVIPNTDTTTVATSSETSMGITTTQATTEATSTESSAIATETATTTTVADADPTPVIINSSFDLDTTEPWLSTRSETIDRDTSDPFEGPASGRLEYGIDGGQAYWNYFYQKVNTNDLKTASYRLSGSIRVDYYTNSVGGDGCNTLALECTLGDPNNYDRVPGSNVMGSPSGAVNNWVSVDTTCTFTEEMLSQYDYVSITFGFNCANVGANLDAVTFEEVH